MDGKGEYPRELRLNDAIRAYGAEAIMGRPLGYGEIQRMNIALQVVRYYQERAASGDWVKWSTDNPDAAALINQAAMAVNDG